MKTIPKNEQVVRYLNDVFDTTFNPIITDELMPRLKNEPGVVHLLTDSLIPQNHPYEVGGIRSGGIMVNLIPFLHVFRCRTDIVFLFVDACARKTDPCISEYNVRNTIFCNDRPFCYATPFDTKEYLEATIRSAYMAMPSFGLIIKGEYVFTDWQDISESTLRSIVKDTIAIIATVFDGEAYLVYEFKTEVQ